MQSTLYTIDQSHTQILKKNTMAFLNNRLIPFNDLNSFTNFEPNPAKIEKLDTLINDIYIHRTPSRAHKIRFIQGIGRDYMQFSTEFELIYNYDNTIKILNYADINRKYSSAQVIQLNNDIEETYIKDTFINPKYNVKHYMQYENMLRYIGKRFMAIIYSTQLRREIHILDEQIEFKCDTKDILDSLYENIEKTDNSVIEIATFLCLNEKEIEWCESVINKCTQWRFMRNNIGIDYNNHTRENMRNKLIALRDYMTANIGFEV